VSGILHYLISPFPAANWEENWGYGQTSEQSLQETKGVDASTDHVYTQDIDSEDKYNKLFIYRINDKLFIYRI
jgi:hypothetical protein